MAEIQFYQNQAVFLTGGTGGLGGCLLYKLAVIIRVPKIFLLVREPEKAVRRWKKTMPNQFDKLARSGSIELVQGDMTKFNFGINDGTLKNMEREVTVVIHAAANISFKDPLRKVVQDNCLASLRLARMALKFENLIRFVQVSSSFANSFLPDGPVKEEVYPIENPEAVLEEILQGRSDDWSGYPWPYGRSKHLTECLLSHKFPNLPLLIIRPTSIGPAIEQPYELYGPAGSIPISTFYSRLMYPIGGISIFHAATGSTSGENIVDEVPVDLAANILLQHTALDTRGVVHASSQNYIPKTLDRHIADAQGGVSERDWASMMSNIVFTTNRKAHQCPLALFYQIASRNWIFDSGRSSGLALGGPLGLKIEGHDDVDFTRKRVKQVFEETKVLLERKQKTWSRPMAML